MLATVIEATPTAELEPLTEVRNPNIGFMYTNSSTNHQTYTQSDEAVSIPHVLVRLEFLLTIC